MSQLVVERLTGAAIERYIDALAALRIEVFRAFPYLYEGSIDYEQHYLRNYAVSKQATLLLARDGDLVVGASTALPLRAHAEQLAPTLSAHGFDAAGVYYFGESVLRESYRGRGIGHAFFDQREAAARAYGYHVTCFCAVERAADDPRRPPGYVPLDGFWHKRGYRKQPHITTTFRWRDLGDAHESDKRMVFWTKELP